MTTAIVSPTGGSVGIGFAIPSDLVRRIVDQLRRAGAYRSRLARRGDHRCDRRRRHPGWSSVTSIERGGPAARAGLRPGDRLLAVDGRPVTRYRGADPRDRCRTAGPERTPDAAPWHHHADDSGHRRPPPVRRTESGGSARCMARPGPLAPLARRGARKPLLLPRTTDASLLTRCNTRPDPEGPSDAHPGGGGRQGRRRLRRARPARSRARGRARRQRPRRPVHGCERGLRRGDPRPHAARRHRRAAHPGDAARRRRTPCRC